MNILIKLTCLIGLVIAPILGGHIEGAEKTQGVNVEVITTDAPVQNNSNKEIVITKTNVDGKVTATVTTTLVNNNEEPVTQTQIVEGTEEEVNAKIEQLRKQ